MGKVGKTAVKAKLGIFSKERKKMVEMNEIYDHKKKFANQRAELFKKKAEENSKKEDDEKKKKVILTQKGTNKRTNMFFSYNRALGPPYNIVLDTNFINFSVQNKIDIMHECVHSLAAKCNLYVSDCVISELEKLGEKFKIALKVAKDPRITRLHCDHKGTYADDCIFERVKSNNVYIVATCDKGFQKRLRKIEGVPIMFIKSRRYTCERLPDADQILPF